MTTTWDPAHYLTYADERGRPFVDLLARVAAESPAEVVDLGCGPGNLTRLLAERWPGAQVTGLDSSAEMVAKARESAPDRNQAEGQGQDQGEGQGPTFEQADLRDWRPARPVDVLVSNATLQWVPGHLDLLPRLVGAVAPGGWLAFQVPGNFQEPSHTILHELAGAPTYAAHTAGVERPASHDPATYLDALLALGCTVEVWETTYLHLLRGEDPVFTWISATGARPVLAALPDTLRADFEADYRQRLRTAYPTRPDATVVLPFRRIFAVARVARVAAEGGR